MQIYNIQLIICLSFFLSLIELAISVQSLNHKMNCNTEFTLDEACFLGNEDLIKSTKQMAGRGVCMGPLCL